MERMQRMDVLLCQPSSLGRAHPCLPGSSRLCCRSPERPREACRIHHATATSARRLPQRRLPPSPVLAYLGCSHCLPSPTRNPRTRHARQPVPTWVAPCLTSRSTPRRHQQPRGRLPHAPPVHLSPSARQFTPACCASPTKALHLRVAASCLLLLLSARLSPLSLGHATPRRLLATTALAASAPTPPPRTDPPPTPLHHSARISSSQSLKAHHTPAPPTARRHPRDVLCAGPPPGHCAPIHTVSPTLLAFHAAAAPFSRARRGAFSAALVATPCTATPPSSHLQPAAKPILCAAAVSNARR